MRKMFELVGGFVEKVGTRLKEKCKEKRGFYELDNYLTKNYGLPKTNALKPLAFSYGDTRRNAFRRA
ncbi:hypothetical protein C2R61_01870, partial [Helicobacter pylori]|uniref:hypothetical protein n=1 Tax=Helicobacter pylori TaxID=210 RepID=UPI000D435B7F